MRGDFKSHRDNVRQPHGYVTLEAWGLIQSLDLAGLVDLTFSDRIGGSAAGNELVVGRALFDDLDRDMR